MKKGRTYVRGVERVNSKTPHISIRARCPTVIFSFTIPIIYYAILDTLCEYGYFQSISEAIRYGIIELFSRVVNESPLRSEILKRAIEKVYEFIKASIEKSEGKKKELLEEY